MGTYHHIDGAKVREVYPGNTRTCGRCHQTQENSLHKISPTIQEKVDQFETDEAKRKADGSPELSKKEKKKSKNRERNVRK